MRQSKRIAVLVALIALTSIGIGNPVMAQDAGPTTRPGGPGGAGGRGRFDPAQFQKMMTDRLKEVMGVSDEDWAAIEPRIEKVIAAQRDAGGMGGGGGAGMRMLFGGGPGGFGAQPEEDESKLSPIALAAKKLQASIDANSGPDELAQRMAAYRAAQAAARQQLADARASLKEVLTHKQEAVLLMVGILD